MRGDGWRSKRTKGYLRWYASNIRLNNNITQKQIAKLRLILRFGVGRHDCQLKYIANKKSRRRSRLNISSVYSFIVNLNSCGRLAIEY